MPNEKTEYFQQTQNIAEVKQ